MAYTVPPSSISGTTPALIVGTVVLTLLGAPGVGFRYRLAAIAIGLTRTVAAGALVDVIVTGTGGAITYARSPGAMSTGGTSGYYLLLPEPGIILTDNDAVEIRAASTVAGGAVNAVAYYVLDDVS